MAVQLEIEKCSKELGVMTVSDSWLADLVVCRFFIDFLQSKNLSQLKYIPTTGVYLESEKCIIELLGDLIVTVARLVADLEELLFKLLGCFYCDFHNPMLQVYSCWFRCILGRLFFDYYENNSLVVVNLRGCSLVGWSFVVRGYCILFGIWGDRIVQQCMHVLYLKLDGCFISADWRLRSLHIAFLQNINFRQIYCSFVFVELGALFVSVSCLVDALADLFFQGGAVQGFYIKVVAIGLVRSLVLAAYW